MAVTTGARGRSSSAAPQLESAYVVTVKVLSEGNNTREYTIVPSMKTLRDAGKTDDPEAFKRKKVRAFVHVLRKGLVRSSVEVGVDPGTMGFGATMDLLESCYALHELDDGGEPEIKYQCSCKHFWQYYKCRHSLGLSIKKKSVKIPDIYNVTNIGKAPKRGRPKKAKPGDALVIRVRGD